MQETLLASSFKELGLELPCKELSSCRQPLSLLAGGARLSIALPSGTIHQERCFWKQPSPAAHHTSFPAPGTGPGSRAESQLWQ